MTAAEVWELQGSEPWHACCASRGLHRLGCSAYATGPPAATSDYGPIRRAIPDAWIACGAAVVLVVALLVLGIYNPQPAPTPTVHQTTHAVTTAARTALAPYCAETNTVPRVVAVYRLGSWQVSEWCVNH